MDALLPGLSQPQLRHFAAKRVQHVVVASLSDVSANNVARRSYKQL
eukprot:SAG31_NODE_5188_length_2691_cov_1.557099_6_plen_45_part_01